MKKENAFHLVILNLIQDLRRLSLSFRNSVRRRFQIKFGMTPLLNCAGFTLIELLVVVLIIGILAAIALPQYQKAVEKSRLTEALHTAKLVEECFDWYLLEHGLPSSGLVELKDMNCPIEINLGEWNEGEEGYMSADFGNYNPGCSRISCYEEIYRLPDYKYSLQIEIRPSQRSHRCWTYLTDTGRYICNSLRNQGWEYVDGEL